jgi:EpsI family protein
MGKIKNRVLVLMAILAAAGLLSGWFSAQWYAPKGNGSYLRNFPTNHEGWQGERVAMDKMVADILETDALVLNRYVKDQKAVLLAIVYYPDAKVDFHAPEACYSGRGIKIDKHIRAVDLNALGTIHVNELNIVRGNSKELVYYFYKSGNFIGNSYNRLRFNLVLNNLFSKGKSGALVRISTPVIGDGDDADSRLIHFLDDFVPLFKKYL